MALSRAFCDAAGVADNVVRQREMNRQTWAALQEAGVADGQALQVDVFFFALEETSAAALVGDLVPAGWRTDVQSSKQGLFKSGTLWSVEGRRAVAALTVDVFDRMVKELDGLAQRHGAEFDGWGAKVPD